MKIVFNDNPWYLLGDKSNKPHFMKDIIELETKDPDEVIKNVYYKDFTINKPVKVGLEETTINNRVTNKTTFNQRLIVTYRPKYKLYQAAIRAGQVERANEIINKKTYTRKRANDPNRFIELGLDHDKVDLNIDTIAEEAKFDGYYGLVTSLFEDDVEDILKVSGYRWKIEDNMRTLKMHLKTRPIHHSLDERITGHLAICFTALLVIRLLEKLLNNEYPTGDILKQLKSMKVNPLNLSIYNSTYTGSELLTKLDKTFNKNLSMTTFTNLQLNKYKRN
ncbi:MAG TPA: transposase [Acholeplasma sp.]|nr:transposase [Acholeplasma sp.]